MDFTWLIEHLLPPSDLYKGCEMIFPDTVFFEKESAKARLIVKMEKKDYCLVSNKNPTKLIL